MNFLQVIEKFLQILFYEVHRDGYYRTAGRRLDSGEGKVDVCTRLRGAL